MGRRSHDITVGLENPAFSAPAETKEVAAKEVAVQDDWDAAMPDLDTGPAWDTLSTGEKAKRIALNTVKFLAVLTLLYFFVCSLDLLSSAFKLISGKSTSALVGGSYISNPIVGLMVGILLTVLVQSSSTSTSIVVSMVSAQMLSVHDAIPIIMGTNVGTSVTNTIVSLTQVGDRAVFRRAFAGATVHDMFNWSAVTIMLPIEVVTGMLEKLTTLIVDNIIGNSGGEVQILSVITEPFTELIVQIDSQVSNCWSVGYWDDVDSMLKQFCDYESVNTTLSAFAAAADNITTARPLETEDCPLDHGTQNGMQGVEGSCHYIFAGTSLSDSKVGIILLVVSLIMLCGALISIVKILNSVLKGSIAIVIKKTLNADIPYIPWITGYIALFIGAFMTFIVQSSSIFTSTLTPLIGIGILSVERAYPLTLGSNIGTTTTALLASMAGTGPGVISAVQIALVHLFFNIIGIAIFYPVPFMRIPIPMCKVLGNITAQYRWFAIVYLIAMFFLLPVSVFALSLAGPIALWCVVGPAIFLIIFVVIVNVLQNKKWSHLPKFLQDWSFVPLPLRSLEPYDKVVTSLPCCRSCKDVDVEEDALAEVISAADIEASRKSSKASVVPEKIALSDSDKLSMGTVRSNQSNTAFDNKAFD